MWALKPGSLCLSPRTATSWRAVQPGAGQLSELQCSSLYTGKIMPLPRRTVERIRDKYIKGQALGGTC